MTDGHHNNEAMAVNALPIGISADSPCPASPIPCGLARQRWAPLIEKICLRSAIAQRSLATLSYPLDGRAPTPDDKPRGWPANPWLMLWREHCGQFFDLDTAEAILADEVESPAGTRLFLAHSYGRMVLTEFVGLALGRPRPGSPAGLYDWIDHLRNLELKTVRRDLRRQIAATEDPAQLGATDCSDVLAAIYQEIFPPALRHLLGEYYTPSWLVAYCLDQAQRHRPKVVDQITILDPAAGSGSFLSHYITQAAADGLEASVTITGFDVNPLAVEFCRANTLLAASRVGPKRGPSFHFRIHLADAVADPVASTSDKAGTFRKRILGTDFSSDGIRKADLDLASRPFDLPPAVGKAFLNTLAQYVSDTFAATRGVGAHVIAGNPPWLGWDGLTRCYRDRLAPQWAASPLVVNAGWRAKVAAGKTEFSSLFVYRAAERHAAENAVMAFVLPLSLFQSHLSGAGFRTFRTAGGRRFSLVALDDFSGVKVFPDAVNRPSVGTFSVDSAQQFPIRYATWSPSDDETRGKFLTCASSLAGPLVASDLRSPIVSFGQGRTRLETAAGKSDYRARGGVNTGGANTIFWLEVLAQGDSTCEVRNTGKSRRGSSPVVTAEVENDAVYPLLRGADMRRWKAAPHRSILLLYDPDRPKTALPPHIAERRLPRAYAFVSRFRDQLESRKEYHRWGRSGPFYEVYRIGPYTFSPIKVAWQHTGYRKALNVSVVDDRGRRPAIPDQKVILISFDDIAEAHYVCAFLSSSVTAALLDRYLGADASTHILDYVALRKFAPDDQDHRRLAALSVLAHQMAAAGADVAPLEQEIDAIVARLRRQ